MNRKIAISFILSFISYPLFCNTDYVIIRSDNKNIVSDTLYGEIKMTIGASNFIRISSNSEKPIKIKSKEILAVKNGGEYYITMKIGGSFVFVKRIIEGNYSLFYYDANLTTTNGGAVGGATLGAIGGMYTHYYIRVDEKYVKVPHSQKKFISNIAPLFISNKDIYNKILTKVYRESDIKTIITEYNEN